MRWFWQKQPAKSALDLRYGDPSHALFNEALEGRRTPPDPLRDLNAPWMKPDTRLRLPTLRSDFEVSHDRDAVLGAEEPVKQTKQNQSGRGSAGKEQDQPKPALKPKGALRRKADQAVREEVKLSELRDAVMEAAEKVSDPPSTSRNAERIQPYVKL